MYKPRVLVIHNRYQQPAGEDAVVDAEISLLRRMGHEVLPYIRDNADISTFSVRQKTQLLITTTWSRQSYHQLRELIRRYRPEIAHCHNLVPMISPAAYYACRDAGIPVIQTLHNYRLLCPAGTFFREGGHCLRCIRRPFAGVIRGCYRASRIQTAAVSGMLCFHRRHGTWHNLVSSYLALSQYSRELFVEAGFPSTTIHVKPNFILNDPGPRQGGGDYALFVGRLTPEKGVLEMLSAWKSLRHIPLHIVGSGPLHDAVRAVTTSKEYEQVKMFGQLSSATTRTQIRSARFLLFPSRWHEPFGLALIEAAACGVAVVASRVGGIPELVRDRVTGLLFDPEAPTDLAAKASWAWDHAKELAIMGSAARRLYLQNYTADRNYQQLMSLYEAAQSASRQTAAGRTCIA